jgi:hypothetical protein
VTERYRRLDYGHIDLHISFDDPQAHTRPWTFPLKLDLNRHGDLIECVYQNERDEPYLIGKSGKEFWVPAEVLAAYAGTYGTALSPVVTRG